MKRVLVTGATGFIGRHCLPFLEEKDYEIHAVSSKINQDKSIKILWHQADLLEPLQVAKLLSKIRPTHLLHFAWYAIPKKYWTSLENIRWVQASLYLLQAFASNGGKRVVMAGSCAEYDWRYGFCSEETTPLLPITVYGTCKHSLQCLLTAFSRETGLSSAWGRIFFLYGPHEHPDRLVSSVIKSLLLGEPARCSHGNQIRDFLYVADVASAFVALLEGEMQGQFNIGSGQPISLKQVVGKIGKKVGREDLISFGTSPVPDNDPPLLVADNRKLTEKVKWIPGYGLDEGLDQSIEWWKHQIDMGRLNRPLI
jgi:nucleoside-diphosphate-sugar epimerase